MSDGVSSILAFWSAGGTLMPILAAVSVVIWYQTFSLYLPLSRAARNMQAVLLACESGDEHCIEDLLSSRGNHLQPPRRRLLILKAFVAAAPLLGLLGTVKGMILTFVALGGRGTASMDVLSTGISEALITTQVGLAVALPGLVGAHASARLLARLETLFDRAALHLSLGDTA